MSQRKSYMEIGEIYFSTATINKWQNLLINDTYKNVITDSLEHLLSKAKMDVFAFVIMPNHIHLIWRMTEMNGKETPQGSFFKYTAHAFKKLLAEESSIHLNLFASDVKNKEFEFWQRDSMAIHLFDQDIAYQKLDYIHSNPLSGKWSLVKDPCDYEFSSAKFYIDGIKEYSFIKDLREEF